jgi:hypothetical protein
MAWSPPCIISYIEKVMKTNARRELTAYSVRSTPLFGPICLVLLLLTHFGAYVTVGGMPSHSVSPG